MLRASPDAPDAATDTFPAARRQPFWPGRCGVCGLWCAGGGICPGCVLAHAPALVRCQRCGLVGATPGAPCAGCSALDEAFGPTVVVAEYGFPWDRLIGRLKFGQQPEWAIPLARLLAQAVRQQAPSPRATLVLPVPLSRQRMAERGYNQSWELARRCARLLGLPARHGLLERWRDTPHQVGASRAQRLQNLRDAMGVDPRQSHALENQHVALIDDVLTTGVTVQAASRALRQAGAASVQFWVVCRTPAPERD